MMRWFVSALSVSALFVVLKSSPAAVVAPSLEGRGCCSHHGGVSGSCCKNGNSLCNDGTCSPTCGC